MRTCLVNLFSLLFLALYIPVLGLNRSNEDVRGAVGEYLTETQEVWLGSIPVAGYFFVRSLNISVCL